MSIIIFYKWYTGIIKGMKGFQMSTLADAAIKGVCCKRKVMINREDSSVNVITILLEYSGSNDYMKIHLMGKFESLIMIEDH